MGRRRRARDVDERGDDGENVDEWTWNDVATRVSIGGDDDGGITRKKDAVDDDARRRRDDDDGVGVRMFRWNLARMRRRDGVSETMVTWRTKRAIVGIAWTNAGDAVACATEDGGFVVARARDGVFAWTREGDEEGRGGGGRDNCNAGSNY